MYPVLALRIDSHAKLQFDIASLREINWRIRSDASQAALEYRKVISINEAEVANLREPLNRAETEKGKLKALFN